MKTFSLPKISGCCSGQLSTVLCKLQPENPWPVPDQRVVSRKRFLCQSVLWNVASSKPFICPHQIRGWSWWQGVCHECYNINTLHLSASDQRVVLMTGCMPWMLQHQHPSSARIRSEGGLDDRVHAMNVTSTLFICPHQIRGWSWWQGACHERYINILHLSASDQRVVLMTGCMPWMLQYQHPSSARIRSEGGLDDRVYAMNVTISTPFICPHQIRGWSWWQGVCHECYNIKTLHLVHQIRWWS